MHNFEYCLLTAKNFLYFVYNKNSSDVISDKLIRGIFSFLLYDEKLYAFFKVRWCNIASFTNN